MSTIDPTLIDTTKPETGEATTASVRANESATQTIAQQAKTDIEALESGKLDATHAGQGGAAHAEATDVAAGFMSGAEHAKLGGVEAGANAYAHPNHTGDVTSAGDGATTISNQAVTNPKIADGAVSNVKLGDAAVSAAKLQTDAVTQVKIADNAVGNVELADMLAGTVKLRQSTAGDPQDVTIQSLSSSTPSTGQAILTQELSGAFVKLDPTTLGGGGGSGTVQDVAKDGSVIVTDAVQLDFRDSGDATVTVTDQGGGVARIEVNATAGAGGGGIGKGAPFAVGELMEISSDAGDGEAISAGLTAATVSAHISSTSNPHSVTHAQLSDAGTNTHAQIDAHIADTSTNPHGVTHAQTAPVADEHVAHSTVSMTAGNGLTAGSGGTIAATRTFAVGAGDGIAVNTNDVAVDATVQRQISGGTNGNLVSRDAAGNVQDSGSAAGDFEVSGAVAAHEGAADPHTQYLQNVVEDTAPELGGVLATKGNDVLITQADDTPVGFLGDLTASPGAFLLYTPDGGSFDLNDGGIVVEPGKVSAYGASTVIEGLKHGIDSGRQVYVATSGALYAVDPPPPGWSDSDTDIGVYARSGIGVNVWQQLTGLVTTVAQDVANGEPIDISASIYTINGTTNRTGTVELGFGINGASPASGAQAYPIVESFSGFLNFSFRATTVTLTASDTISVWVRVTQESNAQFSAGLTFDGSANNHEMWIGIPGGGAGGGGGDVVQGSGGADGQLATWQSWGGKTVGGGPVAANVVTNAGTSVDNNLVTMDGVTGKLIQDSGSALSDLAPSSHVGAGGAEHPEAIAGGAAGFLSGTDKTKVDNAVESRQESGVGFLIQNTIAVTQAELGGLTEDPNTLYVLLD